MNRFFIGLIGLMALGMAFSGCKTEEKKPDNEELLVYNQDPLPDFQFMNQDSQMVTQENIKGKVHVMDFFFTRGATAHQKRTTAPMA